MMLPAATATDISPVKRPTAMLCREFAENRALASATGESPTTSISFLDANEPLPSFSRIETVRDAALRTARSLLRPSPRWKKHVTMLLGPEPALKVDLEKECPRTFS